MNTRRFITDHPITANTAHITGDELHHLRNVNRAKPGDIIEIIDGQGTLCTGEIRSIKNSEALADIKEIAHIPSSPPRIIIAPSLLKQQPMNLMIEKLAEQGVDEIRPLIFRRTDDTYHSSRLNKWQRIAFQTLKVNKRLWATRVFAPITIDQLPEITKELNIDSRVLLDIEGEEQGSFPSFPLPALAVIGPPGGIMEEERTRLIDQGFAPFKINDCILKTETAAFSIAAIFKMKVSELNSGSNRAA